MKTILIIISYFCITQSLDAQILTNYIQVCSYELDRNLIPDGHGCADFDSINIDASEDGLYANGQYIYDAEPGGSLMGINSVEAFYTDGWALRMTFRAEKIGYKPLMVIGESWRSMIVGFSRDSLLTLTVGNGFDESTLPIKPAQWYELIITHNRNTGLTALYINEELYCEVMAQFPIQVDDSGLSNTHFGIGDAFQGWWKKITIYTKETTSSTEAIDHTFRLELPNPVEAGKTYNISESQIRIYSLNGQLISNYSGTNLSFPIPGLYVLYTIQEENKHIRLIKVL